MLTRCLARRSRPNYRERHRARHDLIPGDAPEIAEDFIRRAPLRRTGGPEDIDDAVMFLAQSPFITGQVIVVDGGRTLT